MFLSDIIYKMSEALLTREFSGFLFPRNFQISWRTRNLFGNGRHPGKN